MLKRNMLVILGAVLLLAVVGSLVAQPPGGRGFGGRRGGGFSAIGQQQPLGADEQEKKILSVLDDMNRNQSRGMMNVPQEDGRILRLLTEAVGAKHVVEIGTSNGYSGIWFCLALRTTGGKLTTHDIDEGRASLARENFKRAGIDNMVTLVIGDAHQTVTKIKEPIDVLFIDADKEGYLDYLTKLLPLVRPGGLILSHNIEMIGQDYIDAISKNPSLETIQAQGVTVTLKKRQGN
jgi:caffeoyl-CoA O-methyltransferase